MVKAEGGKVNKPCAKLRLYGDFHSFHRGVESSEKKCGATLDIYGGYCMITNGSALAKSVSRAGDSQSGLKYSKVQIL